MLVNADKNFIRKMAGKAGKYAVDRRLFWVYLNLVKNWAFD
jgi:hypothetical protein